MAAAAYLDDDDDDLPPLYTLVEGVMQAAQGVSWVQTVGSSRHPLRWRASLERRMRPWPSTSAACTSQSSTTSALPGWLP